MISATRSLIASAALLTVAPAHATLTTWQAEVAVGTAPAATLFSTVSGAAPQLFDVGSLTADRSLEFIYNASPGGASQALIGTQDTASGRQGLKVNQWNNTGMYGVTDFGVADYTSSVPYLVDQDVHIVFTSDGVNTEMYLNGAPAFTFPNVDLTLTGTVGIGAAYDHVTGGYFDLLLGNIHGFASYDSALSPAEVSAHYDAFLIPEPGVAGLAALAGLTLLTRRRK